MISTTLQQTINEITFGNLRVQEFSNVDEVQTKLDDIRQNMKTKDSDIYGFDFTDYAQERFEQIYDIAPYMLIHLFKTTNS